MSERNALSGGDALSGGEASSGGADVPSSSEHRPSVPAPDRPPSAWSPGNGDGDAVIDPAPRRRGRAAMASGGFLLVSAAVLQVLALVPSEASGDYALGHLASTTAPPVVLAAGLLLAAVLLCVPRRRAAPAATTIAAGLLLADLGLLVSELGSVAAQTTPGAGDWLLTASWVTAAVGTLLTVAGQRGGRLGRVSRPRRHDNALFVWFTVVVGVVLGYSLLPAWVRFHLTFIGGTRTSLQGSAFAVRTPGLVLGGDLLAAVAFAAVPVVTMLWRPGRIGVLACLGVAFVVVGQTLSAVLQTSETRVTTFLPLNQARAVDLSIRTSLTGWFDAEVVAVVALLLLVVARWWTPAGGSLLDAYPIGAGRDRDGSGPVVPLLSDPTWWGPPLAGSTAHRGPGHIGHGAGPPPSAYPPPGPWSGGAPEAPHGSTAGHH